MKIITAIILIYNTKLNKLGNGQRWAHTSPSPVSAKDQDEQRWVLFI